MMHRMSWQRAWVIYNLVELPEHLEDEILEAIDVFKPLPETLVAELIAEPSTQKSRK